MNFTHPLAPSARDGEREDSPQTEREEVDFHKSLCDFRNDDKVK